jgi:thiol-disulfide isomerase/thioredoxin
MKIQLAASILALLVCRPLGSSADQNVQARFEKSLKDIKALSSLELEYLDTLCIKDPAALKVLKVNTETFARTVQYSYTLSGSKFRATSKLVSGTKTNLAKLLETAFDGRTLVYYSGDTRYMTKGKMDLRMLGRDNSEGGLSPLIAPFQFLEMQSYRGMPRSPQFADVRALDLTNVLVLPTGQNSNGFLEVSVQGLPIEGQPTTWKIGIDEAGDSFTPKTIEHICPTRDDLYRFTAYTNLGAYRFPSRIEHSTSSYPPTAPPTLLATGLVTVISARIPDHIEDSVFRLDEEEKLAKIIFDSTEKKFIKLSPEALEIRHYVQSQPNIYDESADGREQIADALEAAKAEHKHVLLDFGANWCAPCHWLHQFFESNQEVRLELKGSYVVVMIDVNKKHNKQVDKEYGHPTQLGLPSIVVLDSAGKRLTTQDTEMLWEGNHLNSNKVMAFLKEWSPNKQ